VNDGGDCGSGSGNAGPIECFQVPYYLEARTQDGVKERLTQAMGSDASVSFNTGFTSDRYPSAQYGRTADYKVTAGPDVNYNFDRDSEAHFFYTFERSYNRFQDNSSTSSGTVNQAFDWSGTVTADTHTTGFGGSIKPLADVKFGADYLFSYGLTGISQNGALQGNSSSLSGGIDQLPNVTSMLNSIKLHGEYEYVPGVTFYLGYAFDRLISNDFADIGTSASQYSSGEVNPSYSVHSVVTKVSFKW
jgi:hypothetical protein